MRLPKFALTVAALVAAATLPVHAADAAPPATWRSVVEAFAQAHLQHTAWGVAHAERDYRLASELARREGLKVDDDVLFAAAYLHDVGAIEPYRKDGVDHAARSVELLAETLPKDFPAEKVDRVKAAILGHMFSADPGDVPEAIVLHDADTLDFMGTIGVFRIASLATRHPWATDNATAIATLRDFARDLPPALKTAAARTLGEERLREMQRVLAELDQESAGGASL